MSERITPEKELFYDPFASQGEQYFDPEVAHQAMWEKYAGRDVEHDYTADKFVSDTEALMLDAQFVGQFDQAQAIAERMHVMCGEDHGLQQSVTANESLSGLLGNNNHDGHDHGLHAKDEDDDKKDKKKKKKRLRRGWFSITRD
jgi:hypothetical protein